MPKEHSASNHSSSKMPSSFLGSDGKEFAVGTQLGTGSSGTVFTCTDLTDDSVYAVKIVKLQHMKMSMTGDEYEAEKRKLHREVRILQNLSHPNIVKLIDVSESNDSVYVVQELIEGGELFSRITDDPNFRNENVVKFFYCQLADALLYLHSKSVIHRDIKPENILVQSCDPVPPPGYSPIPNCPVYPVIKVVDFGLSKEITSMASLAQTWVGTPQYWAPEVILSREKGTPYDGRADLWSVGVMLYVCLCRRYPFTDPKFPGDASMQDRILKGQFSFPVSVEISSEAKDLISKLIVPNMSERITLQESFLHPWLSEFSPAQTLAHRWPVNHTLMVIDSATSSAGIGNPGRPVSLSAPIISEPSVSSASPSPVTRPQSPVVGVMDDLVPFIFPAAPGNKAPPPSTGVITKYTGNGASPGTTSGPIVPNIALAQQCANDQFQLAELAMIQNEIIICFSKIQKNFHHHPNAFHLMASLISRARELQFVSATTISRFAITAELAENIIDDSAAFVEAGAIEASLSCVEEIRNSVVEMMQQCRVVQEQYRSLLDDVNNLIAGSRIVLNTDPTVRQALEDILRSENSRQMNSSSPPRQGGGPPRFNGTPPQSSNGSSSRNSLNNLVATAMSGVSHRLSGASTPLHGTSDSVATESVVRESLDLGDNALLTTTAEDSTEQLLNSSLRDLRRVDDILGKCRFFWSNMEQCLLRLDHFKTTSYRLLENVHLSRILMDRYLVRVAEHRAFWSHFKSTCAEYAKVSQIEYQKFITYESNSSS